MKIKIQFINEDTGEVVVQTEVPSVDLAEAKLHQLHRKFLQSLDQEYLDQFSCTECEDTKIVESYEPAKQEGGKIIDGVTTKEKCPLC